MYYIQYRVFSDPWERIGDEEGHLTFDDVLSALEYRDQEYADNPNDGITRKWRVVDESGTVYEYQTEHVSHD